MRRRMGTRTMPVRLSSETVSSVASDTGDDATSVAGPLPLISPRMPQNESGVGIFYL